MKKLYLIGGTMGVGKTSVCQELNKRLASSVFLDGDWCWNANPFQVNDETKRMVIQNICFLLNQFIHCSVYENVVFCWVMHEQSIIDEILAGIDKTNCDIKIISLICSPSTLLKRLENDINRGIRTDDIIERSINRIALYDKLNTIKIVTDGLNIDFIANQIAKL